MIKLKVLNTKAIEKLKNDIRKRLSKRVAPFKDTSEEAKAKRRARALKDKDYFQITYLPHYVTEDDTGKLIPDGPFHRELFDFCDEIGTPGIFALPRNFGKSTKASLIDPLHKILFKLRHFIVILSDTDIQASGFTSAIKLELEENERIKCDFNIEKGSAWSDPIFEIVNTRVLARGRGQKIRGLKYKQWRPDHVIVDDYENDRTVKNPRIVREGIKYLLEAVIPALGKGGIQGTFIMIGNVFAKRSVIGNLLFSEEHKDKKWNRKIYRAIIDEADGRVLWPEYFPLETLMKIKSRIGTLAFNKEYQHNPADDNSPFREEWIKYYSPGEIQGKNLTVITFGDPSCRKNETSDFKVWVTIGRDRETGIDYVLNAYIRKISNIQFCRAAYPRYREYNPVNMGLETNAAQIFLRDIFDFLDTEYGYSIPLKNIDHYTNKIDRILSLSPRVENGKLRFLKGDSDQDILIEQFVFYDEGKTVKDDGPDAVEGAIKLLDEICSGGSGKIYSGGVRKVQKILENY